jgi:hypothetical protein
MLNSYDTSVDAPVAHLDKVFLFSLRLTNLKIQNIDWTVQSRKKCALWSLMKDRAVHEEDNPSF